MSRLTTDEARDRITAYMNRSIPDAAISILCEMHERAGEHVLESAGNAASLGLLKAYAGLLELARADAAKPGDELGRV